ncbi:MAG: hypothetical protein LRY51_10470 [Geovibrio sp.]|nr:hypothetical protein [Geovibrio sp.]
MRFPMIFTSIQQKIFLYAVLLFFGILTLSSFTLYFIIKTELQGRITEQLNIYADSLTDMVKISVDNASEQYLKGTLLERAAAVDAMSRKGFSTAGILETASKPPLKDASVSIRNKGGQLIAYGITGSASSCGTAELHTEKFVKNSVHYISGTYTAPETGWCITVSIPSASFKDILEVEEVREAILAKKTRQKRLRIRHRLLRQCDNTPCHREHKHIQRSRHKRQILHKGNNRKAER